jgi:hypothetical protein
LAARTSPDVEEARAAYAGLQQVDLRSAAVVLDESATILSATGTDEARADTFVGLLLAARERGALEHELVDILDAGWLWIESALSDWPLLLLLEALGGLLALDSRFTPRFVHYLADQRDSRLRGAILAWCGNVLEQGGRFTDHDTSRIAVSLTEQAEPMPRVLFAHLWDWAIDRHRADVMRGLMSVNLSPEVRAFRQSSLERLMARFLSRRQGRLQKVAEALETLETLQRAPDPDENRLRALASRADRCPIHAAAYVAWLEERCADSKETMGWRTALFRVYVRIGLTRKAVELAKAFPDLGAGLGVDPRRYLAGRPRAEVSWPRWGWEDGLVSDFQRFLREVAAVRSTSARMRFGGVP